MQLASYAGTQAVRIDYLQLKLEGEIQKIMEEFQIDEPKRLMGPQGVILGVHLTNGIYHSVECTKAIILMTALTLGALNPGEVEGFKQSKTPELTFRGFCACCNKITGQRAKACSRCLAVHCENYKINQCVMCKCVLSQIK